MRILAIAGPSGGHIFPALGFLDSLKNNRKIEKLLILPRSSIIKQAESPGYKIKYVSVSNIQFRPDFKNLIAILRFIRGILESLFILWEFRPHIVVGFGSISSLPMVMLAWGFGIKTLIHEQNVVPGRANRILAKFSDRIAITFAESKDYFKDCQKKIILTGSPMRKELTRVDKNKALDFFGFSYDKFTIVVIGGSQGSHRINASFLKAVSGIRDRSKIQVIHIAGSNDYELVKQGYKDLDVHVKIFSFLNSMQYAYSGSDLVVSRGGATTIAEIIFFGLPAIIIPYPHAHQHQLNNARVLEKKYTAFVISDDDALETDILKQTVEYFMDNPDKIKSMRSAYAGFTDVSSGALFTQAVLSLNE